MPVYFGRLVSIREFPLNNVDQLLSVFSLDARKTLS